MFFQPKFFLLLLLYNILFLSEKEDLVARIDTAY